MTKSELIPLRVTPKMKEDLKKLAAKERRELSDFIRIILEDKIKQSK